MRWGGDHKQAQIGLRAQIFTMKRRCPGAVGRPGAFADIVRPGPPVGDFSGPGGALDGRATVGATARSCAHTVGYGWAASAVPPAGWLPSEVGCHDMRKKVIPFPPRTATNSRPVIPAHSRITVPVGAQRYTLHIPGEGVALPPEPVPPTKGRLEHKPVLPFHGVPRCAIRGGHATARRCRPPRAFGGARPCVAIAVQPRVPCVRAAGELGAILEC